MNEFNDKSPIPKKGSDASGDPMASRTLQVPHALQDLTGVAILTKPIPEQVYDHVMKRDARILERLANV